MSLDHVAPPTICTDCQAELHRRIPADQRVCNLILPCRHTSPGAVIVATVFVLEGAIGEWMISGPMDEQRAAQAAAQFLEANRAAGGKVEDIATKRRARGYN